jgi:hypothetical protein
MATLHVERESQAPRINGLHSKTTARQVVVEAKAIESLLGGRVSVNARRARAQLAHRAEVERWSPRELLAALLESQCSERPQNGFARGSWLSFAMGR